MTASYLKNKITAVYGSTDNPIQIDPRVYTVGLGITGLSGNDLDLAMATLDPKANFGNTTGSMFRSFNSAFATYLSGGTPTVTVNANSGQNSSAGVNYLVGQVPQGDSNQVTDLRYNDAFYAPVTKDDLVDVFTEIAKQIVAPVGNPPTETEQGSAGTSGHVTFTDPLGQFMEVERIDQLTFCSVQGEDPDTCELATFTPTGSTNTATSTGSIDSYTFTGSYAANEIYGTSNVGDIKVTVERFTDPAIGDTVTVKIPASLLPLRNSYIEENVNGEPTSMEVTVSHPVHVYYVVEPKDGVVDSLGDPYALNEVYAGAGDALAQYVRSNTVGGRVQFFSNDFTAPRAATRRRRRRSSRRPSRTCSTASARTRRCTRMPTCSRRSPRRSGMPWMTTRRSTTCSTPTCVRVAMPPPCGRTRCFSRPPRRSLRRRARMWRCKAAS